MIVRVEDDGKMPGGGRGVEGVFSLWGEQQVLPHSLCSLLSALFHSLSPTPQITNHFLGKT